MVRKYRKNPDETVEYYDNNASAFIESTINVDLSQLYAEFEKFIKPGDMILDLGCGSGRDSKYFSQHGYIVVAIDPSTEMCANTRALVNIPVYEMKAEEIQFTDEFDAVWACASLLHVPRDKHIYVLRLICKSLKDNGICYCSWKYGNEDRVDKGRHFTDYTEESVKELLKEIPEFKEIKVWITYDVRNDRQDQKWLNVLIKKKISK